jgi:hypothetical protein
MEDLVERELSGFWGQSQNFDNRVQERAKAMKKTNAVRRSTRKASNEAPTSKSLILFTPRPTNVLDCPNTGDHYGEAKERLHIPGLSMVALRSFSPSINAMQADNRDGTDGTRNP